MDQCRPRRRRQKCAIVRSTTTCNRRAFKTLLQCDILKVGLVCTYFGRLLLLGAIFIGSLMQFNGIGMYHPCIQRLQCRFLDFNYSVGPLSPSSAFRSPTSSSRFTCHLPLPPLPSHLIASQSQHSTMLPDFDIQDSCAQLHVQTRRSQYRKASHKFRIHTVRTRTHHLYSHC